MLRKHAADAPINHWGAARRLLSFTLAGHQGEKWPPHRRALNWAALNAEVQDFINTELMWPPTPRSRVDEKKKKKTEKAKVIYFFFPCIYLIIYFNDLINLPYLPFLLFKVHISSVIFSKINIHFALMQIAFKLILIRIQWNKVQTKQSSGATVLNFRNVANWHILNDLGLLKGRWNYCFFWFMN